MRVALLGRTKILYDSIERILEKGNEIVLIGTCAAAPEYEVKERDFEEKAKELGAAFFNDVRINSSEIIQLMRKTEADVAISINWLTIIKQEAISCFKYGILNAHCGDLPKYRGNACPNWSILKGDDSYAISIHYMEPAELDSGDILIKKKFPIKETTTITEIYENMNREVPKLFCEALELIKFGHAEGRVQSKNPEDSLRCYPRIPTDSFIDWTESCESIMRNIRASGPPFRGAFCYWNDLKLYIFEAESKPYPAPCLVYPGQVITVDKENGVVEIAARDGIISVRKFYLNNMECGAADLIKSTRTRLNYCVQEEIFQLRQKVKELEQKIREIEGGIKPEEKFNYGKKIY